MFVILVMELYKVGPRACDAILFALFSKVRHYYCHALGIVQLKLFILISYSVLFHWHKISIITGPRIYWQTYRNKANSNFYSGRRFGK